MTASWSVVLMVKLLCVCVCVCVCGRGGTDDGDDEEEEDGDDAFLVSGTDGAMLLEVGVGVGGAWGGGVLMTVTLLTLMPW